MKQIKTLKQAILALPGIDKRWECDIDPSGDVYMIDHKAMDEGYLADVGIEWFVSAAKTIGMEIWWEPSVVEKKYVAFFIKSDNTADAVELGFYQSHTIAIRAAFIAAVNYKHQEGKC